MSVGEASGAGGLPLMRAVRAHARELAEEAAARGSARLRSELEAAAGLELATCAVAFVGERSRGKSTLINALLGRPGLLPTEVDVTTNAHIAVGPATRDRPADTARVVFVDGTIETIGLDALAGFVSEAENSHNEKGVQRAEVAIDAPLLEEGFRFLDTPGVGGLISAHGRKTLEAVAAADGLVMVLEGEKPMSQPEIDFVGELAERVTRVIFVHNRRIPERGDDEILQANRVALRKRAPALADAPMVIVSARQAERSARERDVDADYAKELLLESDLGTLLDALRRHILGAIVLDRAGAVLAGTAAALEELEAPDRASARAQAAGPDADVGVEEAERELRLLQSRPPRPRLERRVENARKFATRLYGDGLDQLRALQLSRIETGWSRTLAAALPDEVKTGVDALWGEATNSFRAQLAAAAAEIFADYVLGELEVGVEAAALAPRTVALDASALTRAAGAGLNVRLIGELLVVGVRVLIGFGLPSEWVPLAVAGMAMANARRGQRVEREREATNLVESSIKLARDGFAPAFADFADEQSGRVLDKLEVRYEARVESLERTLEALEDVRRGAATAEQARKRLAALAPLISRQSELEASLAGAR
jgi:hypothetical protein